MNEDDIREECYSAGFSKKQVDCLIEHFAHRPHTHTIDEVDGLEEELEELGSESDIEDEDEDED